MTKKSASSTGLVLLCCLMGVISALLHWLVPTRIMLQKGPEYVIAIVAALLATAAFFLFYLGFLVPQIRTKKGLDGRLKFYMPALCWSAFGFLIGAAATLAKVIRALMYHFVPVQTEGLEWSFSVLTLANVPVFCCFAVLFWLEQRQPNE